MGAMTQATPNPKLEISAAALAQIDLIQRHDYTLEGMSFRVKIGGKGCDGFTYQLGFSAPLRDDIVLRFATPSESRPVEVRMDPFTAYYTQAAGLDYRVDPETQDEGFVLTNHQQALFRGKFFKDESLVPPPKGQA